MIKLGIMLFFSVWVTISQAQISYLLCDSTNSVKLSLSAADSTSIQIGDFDGDQLRDTCIAILKGSGKENQKRGLLFLFGNGDKKIIGANSNSIIIEIFDINEQQQTALNDLYIISWVPYKISSIIKKHQNEDSISNNQIPSLEHMINLNLSPYYKRINKNTDLLLIDTGDVWFILCKSKDEWLFINLGA